MKINDSVPDYVLERISNIMKQENLKDITRVGLYGLTYKENVDDVRESPTLQMLRSMEEHMAGDLIRVYDPYVKRDIVPNQCHSLEEFLGQVDMVIVMVGHEEIRSNMDKLKDKIVFDTRNICTLDGVYRL